MVVRTLLCRMIAKSYVSFPSFGSVRLLWDTSSVRRVTAWLEDTERDREQVTHYVETPILVVQHRFLRSHTQRGLADNPRWRVWRSNRQKKNQLRDRVQPLDKRERCEARDEGVARVRCSWRENGGEGSPGSAALSLYARNNILMKERPDSEVPTSGRAAELLASPPLRGRPLPPLHDTGTAECAPYRDYPHHSSHHHTKPRPRTPLRLKHRSSCAAVIVGESGRGLMLRRGVASPTLDAALTLPGGGACWAVLPPRPESLPLLLSAVAAGQRQRCRDSAEAENDSAETPGTPGGGRDASRCSCLATSRISFR